MAGNELEVCRFLLSSLNTLELPHIGIVTQIASPRRTGGLQPITALDEITRISTADSKKKADVYLNGRGISIKQKGASVLYNRLQRKNLENVYRNLDFTGIADKLKQLDIEVAKFHRGEIVRDRQWINFFTIQEFKKLLKYLMLQGSPNHGVSKHPAEFILEASFSSISGTDIKVYLFDEYFDRYSESIYLSIRRSWVGQASKSEHSRALSLSKRLENQPWVFHDVTSIPRSGWREDFPESYRKTVYYLMITKVGN